MRSWHYLRLYPGVFLQAVGNTVVNLTVKSTYSFAELKKSVCLCVYMYVCMYVCVYIYVYIRDFMLQTWVNLTEGILLKAVLYLIRSIYVMFYYIGNKIYCTGRFYIPQENERLHRCLYYSIYFRWQVKTVSKTNTMFCVMNASVDVAAPYSCSLTVS
jgi:hypothetical protein